MRFFLDTFIGDGTDSGGPIEIDENGDESSDNPFRSAHAEGDYSIIDLRPDSTNQAGLCLVGHEGSGAVSAVEDFGDTLDQRLNTGLRNRLGNQLGITLEQSDLRGVIAELLLLHGREDGTRWRRLRANRFGRHKIWLGGQLVYDAPAIRGTTITESWDSADSDSISADLTWTEVVTDIDIVSNMASDQNDNNSFARAEHDLATDDHSAQYDVEGGATGSNWWRVCARYEASADTCYFYQHKKTGTNGLSLREAGSNSSLASGTGSVLVPGTDVMHIEVDGSSLEGFINDVSEIGPTTDTTLTGQTRVGIGAIANGANRVKFDNFVGTDLAAVAVTRFIRSNLVSRKPLKKDDDRLASTGLISAGKST